MANCSKVAALYPNCSNIIVYSEGSFLHAPIWADTFKHTWKVSPDLLEHIKTNDLISDLFQYARENMPEDTIFLHSNTVWDGTLIKFMSKMNHGKMEITQKSRQEFHELLVNSVRKLKAGMGNYYYFLTDYGKSKKDGTTAHLFSGSTKLLYNKTQDDVSVADWLIKAIEGNPFDVGGVFLPPVSSNY